MAKEIMKKQTTDLVSIDEDMFKGVDTGFEGTSSDTFKTPFMKILQSLSPELKKSNPDYNELASAGLFCNTATKELHETIDVVLLKVEHSIIAWRPDRGGFAGRYNKSEEGRIVAKQEGMEKWDSEGNELIDAIEFFCMNANDYSDVFILSLSKASLKHAKSFATRVRSLKANGKPVGVSWAGVWNISLVEEKNDKGDWFTIGGTPKFERFITREERDNFVIPLKDMLKVAMTDYTVVESETQEKTEY